MRKHLLIIAFAFTTSFLHGQIVNIPDAGFKYALLNHTPIIDKNNDKEIQVNEAISVTSLSVSNKSIKDLTGIQAFTALITLYCTYNNLTTLDVSKNTALTTLYCFGNQINTLDVIKNTALTRLECQVNQLTTLDVSKNTALIVLSCFSNQLTTICINTTQVTTGWEKDATAQFSTTCSITTALEDTYTLTTKLLHHIITPLGQEIKPEQANEGVFIYQYSDGSTKKVMNME